MKWIFTSIVIIILVIVAVSIQFNNSMDKKDMMENFCITEGFEGFTDYKTKNCGLFLNHHYVECDGEEIFETRKKTICLSHDKWGDCLKEKSKYVRVRYWGNISLC